MSRISRISVADQAVSYLENSGNLMILECGREICVPNKYVHYKPEPNRHFVSVHYIMSGEGTLSFRGKTYNLKAGDIFFVPAFEECIYVADSQKPWFYCWFKAAGQKVEQILHKLQLSQNCLSRQLGIDADVKDAFLKMVDCFYNYGAEDYGVIGYFYVLLSVIERKEKTREGNSRRDNYIKEALTYINYNFMNDIKIVDIARDLCLNVNYLGNIFKETLGISPKQYLSILRIKNACALLKESDMNINEIALSSGFKDSMYFAREFKKYTLRKPTEYRGLDDSEAKKIIESAMRTAFVMQSG